MFAAAMMLGFGLLLNGGYIHAKAWLAQYLLARSWEQSMFEQRPVRPWPGADTWPVARMIMPQYQVDLMILSGDSGRTLAFGPGARLGTSLPGQGGNSMISAHRDTHFSFLRNVKIGDAFYIQNRAAKLQRFVVRELAVVDQPTMAFQQATDYARVALVTCYPFDAVTTGGPQRFVVIADEDAAGSI